MCDIVEQICSVFGDGIHRSCAGWAWGIEQRNLLLRAVNIHDDFVVESVLFQIIVHLVLKLPVNLHVLLDGKTVNARIDVFGEACHQHGALRRVDAERFFSSREQACSDIIHPLTRAQFAEQNLAKAGIEVLQQANHVLLPPLYQNKRKLKRSICSSTDRPFE